MIYEAVIVTRNADSTAHVAPLGFRWRAKHVVLAPFRPSTTLDNLERSRQAVVNLTDNVAVIAGSLTGRRDWAIVPAHGVQGWRLADTLAHMELEIESMEDNERRPRFFCNVVHQETHSDFKGFNRAQAAVIEAAILVSRLHLLPADKIDNEIGYLKIALEKTGGERERLAWGWLMERIDSFRRKANQKAENL
ncbi:MAG: DUF447 domain-containing protein [Gammaproteobacteria bacterium]